MEGGLSGLGEFLLHHVADNRSAWRIFPGVEIPLDGSFRVAGVELYPSLHVLMLLLALVLLVALLRGPIPRLRIRETARRTGL